MQRIDNPIPLWIDNNGSALDLGYIYIGASGADPQNSPIQVYWDAAGTIPAAQPLRTVGGYIVNGATPALVYVSVNDYSLRIRDENSVEVVYIASSAIAATSYQPLDSDLTAIAALTTTAFGRNLLTIANQAALQAAVGLPAAMPLTGGTFTGNITRQGAGKYLYYADAQMTGGRVYVTDGSASDPTTQPGDQWLVTG